MLLLIYQDTDPSTYCTPALYLVWQCHAYKNLKSPSFRF